MFQLFPATTTHKRNSSLVNLNRLCEKLRSTKEQQSKKKSIKSLKAYSQINLEKVYQNCVIILSLQLMNKHEIRKSTSNLLISVTAHRSHVLLHSPFCAIEHENIKQIHSSDRYHKKKTRHVLRCFALQSGLLRERPFSFFTHLARNGRKCVVFFVADHN